MRLSEVIDPVKKFLKQNKVENYTINPDGTVDVDGDAKIITKQSKLPVKFGRVKGYFYCDDCDLTSLEGAPSHVGSYFACAENNLTSLVGAPSHVGDNFYCNANQLTSLAGAPSHVGSDFYCNHNRLISLHDVHKHVVEINGGFYCDGNPIKDSVLGLLLVKGVKRVHLDNKEVQNILNKYLGQGRSGVISAQQELLDAGLDKFAKL